MDKEMDEVVKKLKQGHKLTKEELKEVPFEILYKICDRYKIPYVPKKHPAPKDRRILLVQLYTYFEQRGKP